MSGLLCHYATVRGCALIGRHRGIGASGEGEDGDGGGTLTIQMGATPDPVTHTTTLPMRAELLSVWGDGEQLIFEFQGSGTVSIAMNPSPSDTLYARGHDRLERQGNTLRMIFDSDGAHTGSITFEPTAVRLPSFDAKP